MAFIPDQLVTAVIPSVSIILFSRVTMLTNGLSVVSIFKPISLTARTVESLWLNLLAKQGYNLHLYSNYSQFFHLYGGISALAGYETVNWGKTLLPDGATLHNSDAFIYGGAVNIQADFYLSDRIALTANLKERFVFGNSTGHFRFAYGLGVRLMMD